MTTEDLEKEARRVTKDVRLFKKYIDLVAKNKPSADQDMEE